MLTAERSRRRAALSIKDVLAPVSLVDFLERYWEKEHLFLNRDGDNPYASIFGFGDIDRYLTVAGNHPEAYMSLGKTGEDGRVRMNRMRVGEVQQKDLFKAFHTGSTIMLDSIDRCWPAAAELAAVVGDALGALVKVNAYITPPGFQGAPIHPDIQDVLALQTEGSKEWFIYEDRFYEPVESLDLMGFVNHHHFKASENTPIKEKRTVFAGDLLYLPRGLVHKAVAPPDAPSIHLALCVTPYYWVDFLKAAVETASAEMPELSAALPVGFEKSDADRGSMRSLFREFVAKLDDDELFERTLNVMRGARVTTALQAGDGHLEQILKLDEVQLSSRLSRRPGLLCTTRSDDSGAVLSFGPNGQMGGPAALKEAFLFICRNDSFLVSDLPGQIGDSSKLTLAKRLIRDGLLRMEDVGE